MQQDYLSIAEVAANVGVSKDTVRRRVADGTLPAVRVGRLVRIRRDDVEKIGRPVPTAGRVA